MTRATSQRERPLRRVDTAAAGFTLVEIMAALFVFMIGVMGMVALQGASIHAAAKSRRQTAAVGIARYVVTQVKSEFAGWERGQGLPFQEGRFPLLSAVFPAADSMGGGWVQYGGEDGNDGDLRIDELLGHSGLEDGAAARFCVNYHVAPLEVNLPAESDATDHSVWQVRVRVSWTKDGYFQTGGVEWRACDPNSVAARIVTQGSDDAVELVSTATRELSR